MQIETIVVGPLQVNCYVVFDEKTLDAAVIDPGDEPDRILKFINSEGLHISSIICTHAHFDHVGGAKVLRERTDARILLHVDDLVIYMNTEAQGAAWGFKMVQPPHPDSFVQDGEIIKCGNIELSVMHTPGHSPGGICLKTGDVVFTGDTIFAGSIGRTDFFGGSIEALKTSFRKIMALSPETVLYPGHGNWTTVADEWRENFFVQEIR
jgi:glyoxylase-like metal-dependent hydrolase (beta-lactamase superfamily II)